MHTTFQTELIEFAKARVDGGGAPIKMRLVKGCNLEMETVISSLKGWPNPIRPSKTEVDANYLCLLERGLMPENARVFISGLLLIICSRSLMLICWLRSMVQPNI